MKKEDNDLKLNKDQQECFELFFNWLKDKDPAHQGRSPVFNLRGEAGTGKTFLTNAIIQALLKGREGFEQFSVGIAILSPTWVAAGAYPCGQTIHSWLYGKPSRYTEEEISNKVEEYKASIFNPNEKEVSSFRRALLKNLRFFEKDNDEHDANIIIVDEMSMIGKKITGNLLNVGVPILTVGDSNQLPPIEPLRFGEDREEESEGESFYQADADFTLSLSLRQAEGSDVLLTARSLINGSLTSEELLTGGLNGKKYTSSGGIEAIVRTEKEEAFKSVAITYTNALKDKVNEAVVDKLYGLGSYRGITPPVNARIIFLKRQKCKNLSNGRYEDIRNGSIFTVVRYLSDSTVAVLAPRKGTPTSRSALVEIDLAVLKKGIAWTFAYALTCHKAQGSGYKGVFIFDELTTLYKHNDGTFVRKWLYTALTRAKNKAFICSK